MKNGSNSKCLVYKRFFFQILVILLLISLLPYIVFNLYFNHRIKKELIDYTYKISNNELLSSSSNISSTITQMQDILYYIVNNTGIFENLNHGLGNMSILAKKRYLDTLGQLVSIVDDKARICLYDLSNGTIVASNYGITDITNPRYNWIQQEVNIAKENNQIYISPARLIQSGNKYSYFTTIIHPIYLKNSNVISFIFLDMELLMRELLTNTNHAGDAYTCFIINNEGSIIYHPDNDLIATKLSPNTSKSLISDGKYQKDMTIMSAYQISGTTLYLVADINTEKLFAWIENLSDLILYATIIIVAILSVAAVSLSNVLYKPVRKVVQNVSTKIDSGTLPEDEFDFISSAFNSIENKYKQVSLDLEHAHYILHRNTLLNYLKMGLEFEFIKTEGDLASKQHTYVVLLINNDNEYEFDKQKEILCTKFKQPEFFSTNDGLICVFEYNGSISELAKCLMNYIFNGQISYEDSYEGVISICQKPRILAELHRAYSEAKFTSLLARFLNLKGIICYDEMLDKALGCISLKDKQLYKLEKCFNEFDVKGYGKFVKEYLPSGLSVLEFNRRICFMVTFMINYFKNDAYVLLNRFIDYVMCNEKLEITHLRNFFTKCFKYMCNCNKEDNAGIDTYLKKMNDYIEENFDKLISLDDVVEQLGISKQYFCYIIKQSYNTTFTNYLNKFRVEKAKQMLSNSEMTVKDVYCKVGFSSDSYFIKVFKSITGLTPGEYQKYVLTNTEKNQKNMNANNIKLLIRESEA